MQDFRPTEVQDWKLCPQHWQFKHVHGWKPRTVHKWEVQAWIGTGIHAGIQAWVKQDENFVDVACASLALSHATALGLGREVPPLDDALTSIRVNTRKYCAQAPRWLQTACRGTEVELGSARLDWMGEHEGVRYVVDFKTKRTKPRNLEAYQWGLRRSWQIAEYVRRAHLYPVSPLYGPNEIRAEIQTIVLDKFEVIIDTFTPTYFSESERLKIQMEMDPTGVVWRNEQHCRNWFGGDCPFLRACWEYDADPQRMTVDYVRVPS